MDIPRVTESGAVAMDSAVRAPYSLDVDGLPTIEGREPEGADIPPEALVALAGILVVLKAKPKAIRTTVRDSWALVCDASFASDAIAQLGAKAWDIYLNASICAAVATLP